MTHHSKKLVKTLAERPVTPDREAQKEQLTGKRRLTARLTGAEPPPRMRASSIAEMRGRLGLSQSVFAQVLNVSPETVRAWEQGKRIPDGAAVRLLELVAQHPRWVLEALRNKEDPNAG